MDATIIAVVVIVLAIGGFLFMQKNKATTGTARGDAGPTKGEGRSVEIADGYSDSPGDAGPTKGEGRGFDAD